MKQLEFAMYDDNPYEMPVEMGDYFPPEAPIDEDYYVGCRALYRHFDTSREMTYGDVVDQKVWHGTLYLLIRPDNPSQIERWRTEFDVVEVWS